MSKPLKTRQCKNYSKLLSLCLALLLFLLRVGVVVKVFRERGELQRALGLFCVDALLPKLRGVDLEHGGGENIQWVCGRVSNVCKPECDRSF